MLLLLPTSIGAQLRIHTYAKRKKIDTADVATPIGGSPCVEHASSASDAAPLQATPRGALGHAPDGSDIGLLSALCKAVLHHHGVHHALA